VQAFFVEQVTINGNYRHLATIVLSLCILSALAAPQGPAKLVLAETDDDHWLYLPVVAKPGSSIIGYVTENGSPATDVHLSLLFLDGGDVKSSADATTDTEGKYEFHDLDPLLPDQTYHVFYISDREDRVYAWETPLITNLPPGATVQNETFDIAWANPDMQPAWGSVVTFPVTFTWNRRPASLSESYQLHLWTDPGVASQGPVSGDMVYFETELLGYANSYTLAELPPGFEYGANYIWYLSVHSPTEKDAGQGNSYLQPIVFAAPG
jgi:hypothetical protein